MSRLVVVSNRIASPDDKGSAGGLAAISRMSTSSKRPFVTSFLTFVSALSIPKASHLTPAFFNVSRNFSLTVSTRE